MLTLQLNLQANTLAELRVQLRAVLDETVPVMPGYSAQPIENITENPAELTKMDTVEGKKDATVPLTDESATKAEPNEAATEIIAEAKAKRSRAKKAEANVTKTENSTNFAASSVTDMAAEIEQTKPIDLNAVRGAFDQYVQRFGVQAAQIDGPLLIGRVFPGVSRIKDIPEDDATKLGRVIATVEAAMLTNEFKRPAVQ